MNRSYIMHLAQGRFGSMHFRLYFSTLHRLLFLYKSERYRRAIAQGLDNMNECMYKRVSCRQRRSHLSVAPATEPISRHRLQFCRKVRIVQFRQILLNKFAETTAPCHHPPTDALAPTPPARSAQCGIRKHSTPLAVASGQTVSRLLQSPESIMCRR
jgi:hypothetical protein